MSDYWWPSEFPSEEPRRPAPEIAPVAAAAKSVAADLVAKTLGHFGPSARAEGLKQLLVAAAAELQGLEGHVETGETLYRLADAMTVSCGVPDWRQI